MKITKTRITVYIICAVILSGIGGHVLHKGIRFYDPDFKTENIQRSDVKFDSNGLNLLGTIYMPLSNSDSLPFPAILMLHGTSPEGSHLFLYRVLAEELCRRGFVVFLYDQRGYALSPDPPIDIDGNYALNFEDDAVNAVKFLVSQHSVDPNKIIVVGHSFGGSVAIGVSNLPGIENLVNKIVILSPGRGWPYRGEERYAFRQKRLSRDMELEHFISLKTIKSLYDNFEPETLITRRSRVFIKLINGEYEERLKPLKGIYQKIPPPAELSIIPDTGHYFDMNSIINRIDLPVKIYRPSVLYALVSSIIE